jgi:hypothetical protein
VRGTAPDQYGLQDHPEKQGVKEMPELGVNKVVLVGRREGMQN